MRILLLNQFFWPDQAPTGLLLEDVAVELSRHGHEATVVCGSSQYVDSSRGEPPAVRIVRLPSLPFSRGTPGRLASWGSFLGFSLWHCLRSQRYDVILAMTTPPGLSLVGALMKRWNRTRLLIWEMDLYPDVAGEVDILKMDSPLYRLICRVFDWSRNQADGVIVLGECMRERLARRGVAASKIHVAENWADGTQIQPRPFPLGEPLRILYSGNLGVAHEVQTIHDVLLHLKNRDEYRFVFAGGGAARAQLERFCREQGIENVEFRPYCEREALSESLGSCHLGLVTLQARCTGTVVPSKVYSLLAAGRPYLFIGSPQATPARIAADHQCGWFCAPGDVAGIVSRLRELSQSPVLLREAGLRARSLFCREYDRSQGVQRILPLLEAPAVAEATCA